jgi:hypothetical protein
VAADDESEFPPGTFFQASESKSASEAVMADIKKAGKARGFAMLCGGLVGRCKVVGTAVVVDQTASCREPP